MAARTLAFRPAPAPLRADEVPRSRDMADEVDPSWTAADDSALVRETLAGRRAAFDVLVERHRRQVYRLCYRFSGRHEDASDLAQDTFIRAYRALGGFKGQSAVSTWLYRIAVNVCLNRMSSRVVPVEPIAGDRHVDASNEAADAALLRAERAAAVRAAIARLPKKQRATVILRMYHELRHEEIAGILGSSVGAVKANFFHAVAGLRKMLKDRDR
jgi:RNA polymerase sigma-70 factor (ECF subfamily)